MFGKSLLMKGWISSRMDHQLLLLIPMMSSYVQVLGSWGPGVLGSWVERYLQTSTCQVTNAAAAAQPAKNLKVGIGLGSAPGKIKLPMGVAPLALPQMMLLLLWWWWW